LPIEIQYISWRRQSHLYKSGYINYVGINGLVRNFLRFPGIVEKVLEVSILRVYKGGTNIFRATTKLWLWTLISN
jgi:hypothetical protein